MGTELSRRMLTKIGAVVFVLGLVVGLSGVVSAGSAYSGYGYYSTNGINYKNRSGIHTNHSSNHLAYASTQVTRNGSGNVPSGWMGALPRRFNGSGGLLCTGSWFYNTAPAWSINTTGCYINNHSTYASDGQSRAWNGAGYFTYGAFLSPNQNS